ncbi:30S ribosomal protein S4e, partial [archaeon]
NYKYPVGLMDVIEITTTGEFYRVVPHRQKFLWPIKIDHKEANLKLCRIENKVTVKGGHIQLNLHDGRNILIRVANPMNPEEDVYRTFDSLLIEIPEQNILNHVKLDLGTMVVVVDGRNVGRMGKIKSITPVFKRKNYLVELEDSNGVRFSTILKYVFPVGIDKPLVTVSGV